MNGKQWLKINWFGYYNQDDGYGRFNSRMVRALQELVDCTPYHCGLLDMPDWMLFQQPIPVGRHILNISCVPPYLVNKVIGRHWLFTMTEGSLIPQTWVERIEKSGVERVLVPCQHNAEAFQNSGVTVPISVVPGGTDPIEFPVITTQHDYVLDSYRPYTFLCFADRGWRKGFPEVWDAFYLAFGGKTTGVRDVRLIIKGRMRDNSLLSALTKAKDADARITYQEEDASDMYEVFSQADCVVIPSRSEGWGMIHREAACMGLPVITQAYSGLEDARNWAYVVEEGETQKIPAEIARTLGEWRIVNKEALAQVMKFCYDSPETPSIDAKKHAQWIRQNQTWEHSAKALVALMGTEDGIRVERPALSASF